MKILVIADDYPRPDFIYGDVFVHSRVKQYIKSHEVFVLGYKSIVPTDYRYTYESVPVVITNSKETFAQEIAAFNPDVISVHFMNHAYMDLLLSLNKPIVVFFHGFGVTSWKRRLMNYTSPGDMPYLWEYIKNNRVQLAKMREFISAANHRPEIRFVFVSKWVKEAAEEDLGITIARGYIIPNGIDTSLFNSGEKDPSLRSKILLLRSFKARNYANDIAVDAILKLSKKDFFNQLEFSINGEGYLFKKLTEPLKQFPNVQLNNFFVENKDIPAIHKKFGLFLCPSRLDTQGVSMCEAMSSGLVPITCPIGGIPEYTTANHSSFQVSTPQAIADKIEELYLNPELFSKMSQNAREEILQKCDLKDTIKAEIELMENAVSRSESKPKYQQCTNCLLDNQDDPNITFDAKGVCSYCREYASNQHRFVHVGERAERELNSLVEQIKNAGKGKKYDCILGLSGGVDSSYLALKAHQLGLRPLAVHFDNGWNSELAVKNIEQIISKLGFDLYTLVIDWNEFRDLQLAFLKASVVDIEMVTDHAIIATVYKLAIKNDIKYILSGTNYVTEAILPLNWIHLKTDYVHIKALQQQFNNKPFVTYPLFDLKVRTRAQLKRVTSLSLLNYMPYIKDEAKQALRTELNWRDYGGKHYESVFTRFYQGYILPTKFHIDKRKAHLSNLICSGQITKEQALQELAKPIYDDSLLQTDYEFAIKKLGLTRQEFETIMNSPVKKHTDYPVETDMYERMPLLKIVKPLWQLYKRFGQDKNE